MLPWTRVWLLSLLIAGFIVFGGCSQQSPLVDDSTDSGNLAGAKAGTAELTLEVDPREVIDTEAAMENENSRALATFGSGCFWCTEAVFQRLKGVDKVVSGYMGGQTANPTYEEVCRGNTGHAEVIQLEYDPSVVRFADLLEVFWKTHDPTTLNRQGADVGTQYRSVIFYHDDKQKELAEEYKKKLEDAGVFEDPIVTEISPAAKFYPGEQYHQDFFNRNPYHGYCSFVIQPKIAKLERVFADKLKPEAGE